MRHFLLMIAAVALVGCGKKDDANTGVVKPNFPSKGTVKKTLDDIDRKLAARRKAVLETINNTPRVEFNRWRQLEGEAQAEQDLAEARAWMGLPKPKVKAAEAKLIKDPIVEHAIRDVFRVGELTKADLEKETWLNLRDTKITDTGLKEVANKLQQLTTLFLGGCEQITDAGLKEVAKLKQLETLDLSRTQITDVGLKEVAKLQQLETLDLSGTKITDAGLKEMAKLKIRTALFLSGTKVTKAGVAELQKALPKCEIVSNFKKWVLTEDDKLFLQSLTPSRESPATP